MSKIGEEGLKNLPLKLADTVIKLINRGEMKLKDDTLAFIDGEDCLLIGFDGENLLIKFKNEYYKMEKEILSKIKEDRKIALQLLKKKKGEKKKPEKKESIKEVQIDEKELMFLKKNPLLHILNTLESHHIGNETERKSVLTGFIYALNCVATGGGILKITANSSAGKTNAARTILSCFPEEWIKDVGDISPAALKYIIWKDEKILYIREAGGDERTIQHLKFMDIGDGGFRALVTQGSPSTGFETVEIDIPVKFILTTRAEGLFDLQLENRMFEISIDESEQQTFNVTFFKALRDAGYWKPLSFDTIRYFIRNLETFDEIRVPFSFVFLKLFDMKKVKTRRDYDKLIMLCKASAFLNQKNRPKKEENGRKILYATPEDAYYVMLLAMESFQETTTGLSKKLKAIYDILDENGKTFSQITKELGGPSKKTVQRHCEQLDRLGYADIDTSKKPYLVKKAREIKIEEQRFENYKDAILLFSLATLVDQLGHVELPLSWIDFGEVIGRDSLWDIVRQKKTLKDVAWDKWWDNNETKLKDFYTEESISKLFKRGDIIVLSHPVSGNIPIFVSQPIRREDGKLYISAERRDNETKNTHTYINLLDFLCGTCPGVSPTDKELKDVLLSIIPKEPRSITIEEISQKLKEKDLQVGIDKLRNILKDLCEQGLIRAIDTDFSSFTKPRGEKTPENGEKNLEKEDSNEGKKKENFDDKEKNSENGNNKTQERQFGKLTEKEINLIRRIEDVVGTERLTIEQICLSLGITNLMEQYRVQDLLNYVTLKKDPSTTLRKDSEGYFYNEIGEKATLRALRDFPGFYDRQIGKKTNSVKKGDHFTAPPEIANWLVKKGFAEVVSRVENRKERSDSTQTLSSDENQKSGG